MARKCMSAALTYNPRALYTRPRASPPVVAEKICLEMKSSSTLGPFFFLFFSFPFHSKWMGSWKGSTVSCGFRHTQMFSFGVFMAWFFIYKVFELVRS
jgi:hypothetical protein